MAKKTKVRVDVHQTVTDEVVTALSVGKVLPWRRSWSVSGVSNMPTRATGEEYQGINVIILSMSRFTNPNWMTYAHATSIGAQVRGGEKAKKIVKWLVAGPKDKKTGKIKKADQFMYPVFHAVFNVEQIDGLGPEWYPAPSKPMQKGKRNEKWDDFFSAWMHKEKVSIFHGGNSAWCSPSGDHVQMPPFESFETPEDYYATLAHELSHATKTAARCDRSVKSYALEELVAELSAVYITQRMGIVSGTEVRADHISYISGWLKALKDDKKAIFTAAKMAGEASNYIMGETEEEAASKLAA
jgi:antirestriction protein ArdC